jgi:hypothetical protein
MLVHPSCTLPGTGGVEQYRLEGSGSGWYGPANDRVLDDLIPRYAEFFGVILDPSRSDEANLLPLRDDLEATPVTRANFDALNSVAIGYFELNQRGEQARESHQGDVAFLTLGFRAAKLLGVPWRAYAEVDEPALRDGILDFYADAGSGEKEGTARTVGRLVAIVESLGRKENDPARAARIEHLVAELRERASAQAERAP